MRARNIRNAIETHRGSTELAEAKQTPTTMPAERWTGVLVYPSTVARSYVVRMGQTLAQYLTEAHIARDVAIIEAPSAGIGGFSDTTVQNVASPTLFHQRPGMLS